MKTRTFLSISICFVIFHCSTAVAQDRDEKVGSRNVAPLERALSSLPKVESGKIEAGRDQQALRRHIGRLSDLESGEIEAREIESLVTWA